MSDQRTVARNNAILGLSVIISGGDHLGKEGEVVNFKGSGAWVVDCGNNEIFATRPKNCMIKFDEDNMEKMKALADYFTSGEGSKWIKKPPLVECVEAEEEYIQYYYDEEEEMFVEHEERIIFKIIGEENVPAPPPKKKPKTTGGSKTQIDHAEGGSDNEGCDNEGRDSNNDRAQRLQRRNGGSNNTNDGSDNEGCDNEGRDANNDQRATHGGGGDGSGSNNTNGGNSGGIENNGGNGGGRGDGSENNGGNDGVLQSYFNYSGPNQMSNTLFNLEMKKLVMMKLHEVKVKACEACVEQLKHKVNATVAEVKGREDIKQFFIELRKLEKKIERFVKQCKEWEGDADFDEVRKILLKDIEELKKEREVITDMLAAEDESIRKTYNACFVEMMDNIKISGALLKEVTATWKNFVYQDHVAKLW